MLHFAVFASMTWAAGTHHWAATELHFMYVRRDVWASGGHKEQAWPASKRRTARWAEDSWNGVRTPSWTGRLDEGRRITQTPDYGMKVSIGGSCQGKMR